MGLAPYYTGPMREKVENVFKKMQKLDGINFRWNKKVKNIFFFIEKNFDKFRFDHIASGLQKFTENLLVTWFERLVKKYNSNVVVFSGGTSMNVKVNMLSKNQKIKKFLYVVLAQTILCRLVLVTTGLKLII